MSKLKRCPYCGENGEETQTGENFVIVRCSDIWCRVRPSAVCYKHGGEDYDFSAWNTRVDGWISVDEPPVNDDPVLVWPYMDYGDLKLTATYRPWDKKWYVTCYETYGDEEYEVEPTHWQPLPSPPAGNGEQS